MKIMKQLIVMIGIIASIGGSCRKEDNTRYLTFVNNSESEIFLCQQGITFKQSIKGENETHCLFNFKESIPAGQRIEYLQGNVTSIEDQLSTGIPDFFFIKPSDFPQDTLRCDTFFANVVYAKPVSLELESLQASNFTIYYP
jgi:hypothetical protein